MSVCRKPPKNVEDHIQTFEKDSKLDILKQQIHQLTINFSLSQFNIILNDLEEIKKHLNYLYPNGNPNDEQIDGDWIHNEECRSFSVVIYDFARVYHMHRATLHNDKLLIDRLIKLDIIA